MIILVSVTSELVKHIQQVYPASLNPALCTAFHFIAVMINACMSSQLDQGMHKVGLEARLLSHCQNTKASIADYL